MAQSSKGKLNYRCPMCFFRDLDIDMFYDKDKKEQYCLRCQYVGSEEDVLAKNELIRIKYGRMMDRITDFDQITEDMGYELIMQIDWRAG